MSSAVPRLRRLPLPFTDEEEVLTGELEFDPEMTEQLRAQSTAQAYGWDPSSPSRIGPPSSKRS
jgi:hypothetical protein